MPRIEAMEWPDAGPQTPPGIYLGARDNAFGVDVFQFNFYDSRFKRRSAGWLYLHEAIPGHHLHSQWLRGQQFYIGTSEGWACYVEKLGSSLGVYDDLYARLGALEWDLVRSVRLVLESGIHYLGWDRSVALAYWKKNIIGQDHIAEREIARVTRWPAQAVSYKAGAQAIQKIISRKVAKGSDLRSAHKFILENSSLPLEALL